MTDRTTQHWKLADWTLADGFWRPEIRNMLMFAPVFLLKSRLCEDSTGGVRPALPSASADADAAVRNSRYAQLDDGDYYRAGVAEAGEHGSVLVFASAAGVTTDIDRMLLRCNF